MQFRYSPHNERLSSKLIFTDKVSYSFIWGGYKRLFNNSTELNNYILCTLNEKKK